MDLEALNEMVLARSSARDPERVAVLRELHALLNAYQSILASGRQALREFGVTLEPDVIPAMAGSQKPEKPQPDTIPSPAGK